MKTCAQLEKLYNEIIKSKRLDESMPILNTFGSAVSIFFAQKFQ